MLTAHKFAGAKDLASAIQSITVAVAILIGGAWAAYTFWILKQPQRAASELRKLEIEARNEPRIDLSIDVDSVPGEARAFMTTVTARNKGKLSTRFNFPKYAIVVYRVTFEQTGYERLTPVLAMDLHATSSRRIKSIQTEIDTSKVRRVGFSVNEAGIYTVIVRGVVEPTKDIQINRQAYFAQSRYFHADEADSLQAGQVFNHGGTR